MTTPKFEVWLPYGEDDIHLFHVNGVEVARADYDTHGWEAMRQANRMFKRIADELGVEVTEHWCEGDNLV